jgi:DDE superfamily endonuclease
MNTGEAENSTLVAPGEDENVEVEDSSNFAPRYDFIGSIAGDRPLPPIVFSPEDRKEWGQKGISGEMVIHYIETILAQACGALDQYPLYLVLDKSTAHSKAKILDAFHDNGCQDLVDVWFFPTKGAKRMSPLDNSLFHQWKQRVRKGGMLTKRNIRRRMADAWNNLPATSIRNCIRHCGLTGGRNVYFDCPKPTVHVHN